MEFIVTTGQFEKMIDNKIIGMPKLIDSKINFRGKNNILVCDNNIELENIILDFNGNNSIVYLTSDLRDLFHLTVYNNSSVYIGRDVQVNSSVNMTIHESQNLIIGDDCIIEDEVYITTADDYPIYESQSKKRINYSNSVYIGDHVWIGKRTIISRGVKIGSGTIISNASFIPPNFKIQSNVLAYGNPAKIIKKDVFFIKDFTGPFKNEESFNSKDYKSSVFIYEILKNETLSITDIDDILNKLDVESRWEFIQKLLVQNKRKNRFCI